MKIYVDGKERINGLTTAWTNPVIEAGLMHCRALLKFIGLGVRNDDPQRLTARKRATRPDDLMIEDFSGPKGELSKVSVPQALAAYQGPKEEAEKALAAVIHVANKGLAHTTRGHIVELGDLPLYEIASRGVPALLVNHFYTPLGLPAPDYRIKGTRRADPHSD